MKINALIRSLFVGAALSASSLLANSVVIYDTANDGNIDGGEFLAVTSANGTFLTFCLENFINVTPGNTYSYTINPSALAGGGDTHSPGVGDPISKGTAYLYEQFIKGTLVGPGGVGSYFDVSNRDFNAGLLQKAIWTLEDEYNYGSNYYVTLVQGIFGTTGAFDDAGPSSKVKALNLWKTSSTGVVTDVQSQLFYVPDSGMTAALLGLGLLSLAAFRRKL